ncbi:MAG TPA: hypothetical protein VMV94_04175 [Phycisphaerae bacterium]|nr:hypothetical protein [Phycisphaerae bacterium]
MYKTTLSPRLRNDGGTTQTCEPTLFDGLGLGLNETGKPWSPVDPPLADLSEMTATNSGAVSETHQTEPEEPRVQERVSVVESEINCDDDTVILDDDELLPVEETKTMTMTELGLESSPAPVATADTPTLRESVDFIDEPVIVEPVVEETTTADDKVAVADTPVVDAPVVEPPVVDSPAPPRLVVEPSSPPSPPALMHDRCASQKQGAAPKRIGSGRLVPARLTWKPRDPFACSSKPKHQRFRWEVMLTAACITAVCGLGCVWILRTLLA